MSGKANDGAEWCRVPPPKESLCRRICTSIYDPRERSFLGRTPKKWGVFFAFYLVFYAVLALLFSICMVVLLSTLDGKKPFYTLEESLIGVNPGVAHRPWPIDGEQISYNSQNFTRYVQDLEDFMKPYRNDSFYSSKSECNSEDSFGYPQQPCFLIKLNKVYEWRPQFYNDTSQLPPTMPSDLVEYISQLPEDNRQQLWVSCEGERGAVVDIKYPWGRGIPGIYYPYLNTPGYSGPILAVKLTPTPNNVTVVRCKVWAKNVIQNDSLRQASGYTRILIYNDESTGNNPPTVVK